MKIKKCTNLILFLILSITSFMSININSVMLYSSEVTTTNSVNIAQNLEVFNKVQKDIINVTTKFELDVDSNLSTTKVYLNTGDGKLSNIVIKVNDQIVDASIKTDALGEYIELDIASKSSVVITYDSTMTNNISVIVQTLNLEGKKIGNITGNSKVEVPKKDDTVSNEAQKENGKKNVEKEEEKIQESESQDINEVEQIEKTEEKETKGDNSPYASVTGNDDSKEIYNHVYSISEDSKYYFYLGENEKMDARLFFSQSFDWSSNASGDMKIKITSPSSVEIVSKSYTANQIGNSEYSSLLNNEMKSFYSEGLIKASEFGTGVYTVELDFPQMDGNKQQNNVLAEMDFKTYNAQGSISPSNQGNVWTKRLDMYQPANQPDYIGNVNLWGVTATGQEYNMKMQEYFGLASNFVLNSKGNFRSDTCESIYMTDANGFLKEENGFNRKNFRGVYTAYLTSNDTDFWDDYTNGINEIYPEFGEEIVDQRAELVNSYVSCAENDVTKQNIFLNEPNSSLMNVEGTEPGSGENSYLPPEDSSSDFIYPKEVTKVAIDDTKTNQIQYKENVESGGQFFPSYSYEFNTTAFDGKGNLEFDTDNDGAIDESFQIEFKDGVAIGDITLESSYDTVLEDMTVNLTIDKIGETHFVFKDLELIKGLEFLDDTGSPQKIYFNEELIVQDYDETGNVYDQCVPSYSKINSNTSENGYYTTSDKKININYFPNDEYSCNGSNLTSDLSSDSSYSDGTFLDYWTYKDLDGSDGVDEDFDVFTPKDMNLEVSGKVDDRTNNYGEFSNNNGFAEPAELLHYTVDLKNIGVGKIYETELSQQLVDENIDSIKNLPTINMGTVDENGNLINPVRLYQGSDYNYVSSNDSFTINLLETGANGKKLALMPEQTLRIEFDVKLKNTFSNVQTISSSMKANYKGCEGQGCDDTNLSNIIDIEIGKNEISTELDGEKKNDSIFKIDKNDYIQANDIIDYTATISVPDTGSIDIRDVVFTDDFVSSDLSFTNANFIYNDQGEPVISITNESNEQITEGVEIITSAKDARNPSLEILFDKVPKGETYTIKYSIELDDKLEDGSLVDYSLGNKVTVDSPYIVNAENEDYDDSAQMYFEFTQGEYLDSNLEIIDNGDMIAQRGETLSFNLKYTNTSNNSDTPAPIKDLHIYSPLKKFVELENVDGEVIADAKNIETSDITINGEANNYNVTGDITKEGDVTNSHADDGIIIPYLYPGDYVEVKFDLIIPSRIDLNVANAELNTSFYTHYAGYEGNNEIEIPYEDTELTIEKTSEFKQTVEENSVIDFKYVVKNNSTNSSAYNVKIIDRFEHSAFNGSKIVDDSINITQGYELNSDSNTGEGTNFLSSTIMQPIPPGGEVVIELQIKLADNFYNQYIPGTEVKSVGYVDLPLTDNPQYDSSDPNYNDQSPEQIRPGDGYSVNTLSASSAELVTSNNIVQDGDNDYYIEPNETIHYSMNLKTNGLTAENVNIKMPFDEVIGENDLTLLDIAEIGDAKLASDNGEINLGSIVQGISIQRIDRNTEYTLKFDVKMKDFNYNDITEKQIMNDMFLNIGNEFNSVVTFKADVLEAEPSLSSTFLGNEDSNQYLPEGEDAIYRYTLQNSEFADVSDGIFITEFDEFDSGKINEIYVNEKLILSSDPNAILENTEIDTSQTILSGKKMRIELSNIVVAYKNKVEIEIHMTPTINDYNYSRKNESTFTSENIYYDDNNEIMSSKAAVYTVDEVDDVAVSLNYFNSDIVDDTVLNDMNAVSSAAFGDSIILKKVESLGSSQSTMSKEGLDLSEFNDMSVSYMGGFTTNNSATSIGDLNEIRVDIPVEMQENDYVYKFYKIEIPPNISSTDYVSKVNTSWVEYGKHDAGPTMETISLEKTLKISTPILVDEDFVTEVKEISEEEELCTVEHIGGDCVVRTGDIYEYTMTIDNDNVGTLINSNVVSEFSYSDDSYRGSKIIEDSIIVTDSDLTPIPFDATKTKYNTSQVGNISPKLDITIPKIAGGKKILIKFKVQLSDITLDYNGEDSLFDDSLETNTTLTSESLIDSLTSTVAVKSESLSLETDVSTFDEDQDTYLEPTENMVYQICIKNNSTHFVPAQNIFVSSIFDDNIKEISDAEIYNYNSSQECENGSLNENTGILVRDNIKDGLFLETFEKDSSIMIKFDVKSTESDDFMKKTHQQTLDINDPFVDSEAYDENLNIKFDYAEPDLAGDVTHIETDNDSIIEADESLKFNMQVSNSSLPSIDSLTMNVPLLSSIFIDSSIVMENISASIGDTEQQFSSTFEENILSIDFSNINLNKDEVLNVEFEINLSDSLDSTYIPGSGFETLVYIDDPYITNSSEYGEKSFEFSFADNYSDLAVNKENIFVTDSDSDGFAEPGERVDFEVKVKNNSSVIAAASKIELINLSEIGSYSDISNLSSAKLIIDNEEKNIDLSSGTANLGNISGNNEVAVKFFITIDSQTIETSSLLNVKVTANNENEDTILDNVAENSIDIDKAELNFSKSIDGNPSISPGSEIIYNFEISNSGSATANNVTLKDEFVDSAFDGASIGNIIVTGDEEYNSSNSVLNGDVSLIIDQLDIEKVVKISVPITLSGEEKFPVNEGSKVENVATIDGDYIDNIATTNIKSEEKSNFELNTNVKNTDDYASNGEILTYQLAVKNTGNIKVEDLKLTNSFENLTPQISNEKACILTGDIDFNLTTCSGELISGDVSNGYTTDIKSDEFLYAEFDTQLPIDIANENITNIVKASSVNSNEIVDSKKNIEVKNPTLEISKNVKDITKNNYQSGDIINYVYTIKNTSEVAAKDVNVVDKFQDSDFVGANIKSTSYSTTSSTPLEGRYTESNVISNSIIYDTNFSEIEANETITVNVEVGLNDSPSFIAQEIINIVSVDTNMIPNGFYSAADPEVIHGYNNVGDEKNNDDSDDVVLISDNAELNITESITDEDGDNVAEPGEELSFTIDVANISSSIAKNITISESLLNFTDFAEISGASEAKITSNEVITTQDVITGANIDYIKPGESATINFKIKMKEENFEDQAIFSSVSAKGDNIDATNSVDLSTNIGTAKVNMIKSSTSTNPIPGDTLEYQIIVQNISENGANLSEFRVVDDLTDDLFLASDVSITNVVDKKGNDVDYELGSSPVDVTIDEIKQNDEIKINFKVKTSKNIANYEVGNPVVNSAYGYDQFHSTLGNMNCTNPDATVCDTNIIGEQSAQAFLNKSISDEDKDGIAEPGEKLHYTINITNDTNIKINDAIIKDDLSVANEFYSNTNPEATIYKISGGGEEEILRYDINSGREFDIEANSEYKIAYDVTLKNEAEMNVDIPYSYIDATSSDDSVFISDKSIVTISTGKADEEITFLTNYIDGIDDQSIVDYSIIVDNSQGTADINNLKIINEFEDLAFINSTIKSYSVKVNDENIGYNSNSSSLSDDIKIDLSEITVPAGGILNIEFKIEFGELVVNEGSQVISSTSFSDNFNMEVLREANIEKFESTPVLAVTGSSTTGTNTVSNNEIITYEAALTNNSNIDAYDFELEANTSKLPVGYVLQSLEIYVGNNLVSTDKKYIDGYEIKKLEKNQDVKMVIEIKLPNNLQSTDIVQMSFINSKIDYKDEKKATDFNVENPSLSVDLSSKEVDNNGEDIVDNVVGTGDRIKHVITITNTGAIAKDVNVVVDLSLHDKKSFNDSLELQTVEAENIIENESDLEKLDITIDSVDDSSTITFYTTLKDDLENGLVDYSLKAQASIDSPTQYSEEYDAISNVFELTSSVPNIKVTNSLLDSDADGFAEPGEVINGKIEVTNLSDTVAQEIYIKSGAESFENTDISLLDKSTISIGNNEDTFKLKSGDTIELLEKNQTAIIEYEVKVSQGATINSSLSSTIEVSTKNNEISPDKYQVNITDDSILDDILVINKSNIIMTKNGSIDNADDVISPGETLHYEIDLENTGDATANDIFIVDKLDHPVFKNSQISGLTCSIDEVQCTQESLDIKNGIIITNDIAKNQKAKIVFDVTIDSTLPAGYEVGDTVINTAYYDDKITDSTLICQQGTIEKETGDNFDGCATFNFGKSNPTIAASKTISDTDLDEYAEPGEKIVHEISLTNNSLVDAKNIFIKDDLGDLANIPGSVPVTVFNGDTQVGYDSDIKDGILITELKSNEKYDLRYSVILPEDYSDDIIYSDNAIYNVENDDTDTDTTIVSNSINFGDSILSMSKMGTLNDIDSDGLISPNDEINYILKLTNSGTSIANNIQVVDLLQEDTILFSDAVVTLDDNQTGIISNNNDTSKLDVTVEKIENEKEIHFTVKLNQVIQGYEPGAPVSNIAYYNDTLISDSNNLCTSNTGNDDIYYDKGDGCAKHTFSGVDPSLDFINDAIIKDEDNDNVVEPNEKITYSFDIKGDQNISTNNVKISDDFTDFQGIDLGTIQVIVFNDTGDNIPQTNEIVSIQDNNMDGGIIIDTVSANKVYTVQYSIIYPKEEELYLTADKNGIIDNTATLSYGDDVNKTTTMQKSVDEPEVDVEVSTDTEYVLDSSTINYKYTLTNKGSEAQNVHLVDEFKTSLEYDNSIFYNSKMSVSGAEDFTDNSSIKGILKLDIDDIKVGSTPVIIDVKIQLPNQLNVNEGSEVTKNSNSISIDDDNSTYDSVVLDTTINKSLSDINAIFNSYGSDGFEDKIISNNEVVTYDLIVKNNGVIDSYNDKIILDLNTLNTIGATISNYKLCLDVDSNNICNTEDSYQNNIVYDGSNLTASIDEIDSELQGSEQYVFSFQASMPNNLSADSIVQNVKVNSDNIEKTINLNSSLSVSNPEIEVDMKGYENDNTINNSVDIGDVFRYEIDVKNISEAKALNIRVSDKFLDKSFRTSKIESLQLYDSDGRILNASRYINNSNNEPPLLDLTLNELYAGESIKIVVDVKLGDFLENNLVDYKLENEVTIDAKNVSNVENQNYDSIKLVENTTLEPSLNGVKTVSDGDLDGVAEPNEILTYEVSYTNNLVDDASDAPIENIVIKDELTNLSQYGSLVDAKSYAIIGESTVASGNIISGIKVPVLNPGETVNIEYEVKMNSDVLELVSIDDISSAEYVTSTDNKVNASSSPIITGKSNVSISKSGNDLGVDNSGSEDGVITANETIRYTLIAKNDKNATANANDVLIYDMLDKNSVFKNSVVTIVSQLDGIEVTSEMNAPFEVTLDELAPGQEQEIVFEVKIDSILPSDYTVGESISNVVYIDDPLTYNNTDLCEDCPREPDNQGDHTFNSIDPEFKVTKQIYTQDGDEFAEVSEELKYVIEYKNISSSDAINPFFVEDISDLEGFDVSGSQNASVYIDKDNDGYENSEFISNQDIKQGFTQDIVKANQSVFVVYDVITPDMNIYETKPVIKTTAQVSVGKTVFTEQDVKEISTGQSELIINKQVSDDNGFLNNSDTLNYSFKVTNIGNTIANNVTIIDNFNDPAFTGAEIESIIMPVGSSLKSNSDINGDIRLDLYDLTIAPNQSIEVIATIKMPSELTVSEGSQVVNIVESTSSFTSAVVATDESIIDAKYAEVAPEITISDSEDSDDFATNKEIIHYNILIKNIGSIAANKVLIQSDMAQLVEMNAEIKGASGYIKYDDGTKGQKIYGDIINGISIENIDKNATAVIDFDVVLPESVHVGNISTNTKIEIKNAQQEINLTNNIDVKHYDFTVDKQSYGNDDNVIKPGEIVDYEIKVSNNSDFEVKDVKVIDMFNDKAFENSVISNVEITNAVGNDLDISDGQITIDIAALSTASIKYSVEFANILPINGDEEVTNLALIDTDSDEFNIDDYCNQNYSECKDYPYQDTDILNSTSSELVISKSVADQSGDNIASAKEVLSYKIDVTNISDTSALDVVIKDEMTMLQELESQYDVSNVDVIVDGIVVNSGNLIEGILVDEIDPGQVASIIFDVTLPNDVDSVNNIVNIASVNYDDTIVSSKASITTQDTALLAIDKDVKDSSGDGNVEVGELLTYSIDVRNISTRAANNVVIKDELLDPILNEYVTDSNVDVTIGSDVLYGDLRQGVLIEELNVGETAHISFDVKIGDNIPNEVLIENTASAIADNAPEVIDYANILTDNDNETIIFNKEVIDDDNVAQKGETLKYVISIENPTDTIINDLVVKDELSDEYLSTLNVNTNIDVIVDGIVIASGDIKSGVEFNLSPNSIAMIEFDVTLDDKVVEGSKIVNTASVSKAGISKTDTATIVTSHTSDTGQLYVDIDVDDENGDFTAQPSETLSYDIKFSNLSNVDVENVIIRDAIIDPVLSKYMVNKNVDVLLEDKVVASGDISKGINVGTLKPDQMGQVLFDVQLGEDLEQGIEISNSAFVAGSQVDEFEDNVSIGTGSNVENIFAQETNIPLDYDNYQNYAKTIVKTGSSIYVFIMLLLSSLVIILIVYRVKNK